MSLIAAVALADTAATTKAVQPPKHVLHSQTGIDEAVDHCSDDPVAIGADPSVIATERGLGLKDIPIRFIGCVGGSFQTVQDDTTPNDLGFKIFYRINREISRQGYAAPIIHELGHVYQTNQFGSIGALEDRLCIERIELGADFLAGFSYRNYLASRSLPDFENSLALFGDFDLRNNDFHGSPADRVDAFRMGYFYTTWHDKTGVIEAYAHFQGFDLPSMLFKEGGQNGLCGI